MSSPHSTVTAISHPKTRADYLAEREAFAGDACALIAQAQADALKSEPGAALVLLSIASTYATLATSAATAALVADDD